MILTLGSTPLDPLNMGAVRNCLKALRTRALTVSSTREKLLRPWVGDNSAAGHRIIPARVHDIKIGLRIDRGEQIGDRIKIYLQPNKNAENPTVKALANENSHQNLAEAWVDTTKPVNDDVVKEVFDALEDDLKVKGH